MYVLVAAGLILLAYFLQYIIYKLNWYRNLKAYAYFKTNEVYAGGDAELTETIENAKWLPLPVVKMKLQLSRKLLFRDNENSSISDYFNRTDIYNIAGYQKVTRTMRFSCPYRGYYDFNGVDIQGSDPMISELFLRSVDTSSDLYVYPKPFFFEIPKPILNSINGESSTVRNFVEDPFELRGIREYQTYDPIKNVNWTASAKTDELMVNVHGYTAKRTIRVFVDLESPTLLRKDELMELSISTAVYIISNCSRMSVPSAIYVNSKDILTGDPVIIKAGSGESYVRNVNRALARIDLDKGYSDFVKLYDEASEEVDNEVFTIFVSPCTQDSLTDLLLRLLDEGMDFAWLCPYYEESDTEIPDAFTDRFFPIKAREALYDLSRF